MNVLNDEFKKKWSSGRVRYRITKYHIIHVLKYIYKHTMKHFGCHATLVCTSLGKPTKPAYYELIQPV